MRALNYPFCSVCGEGLALSFWAEVSPIDSATPASPATVGCDPVTFSVTTPTLTTPLSFSWKLDGAAMPETGPSATLTLAAGSHTVELVVEDKTPLIRRDPMLLAREVKTWSVTAGDCLDAGQSGPDTGLADRDASQPGPDAAQPGLDAGLPGRDAAHPGPDAAQPGRDAAQPGPDAAQPGPDAAQPGPDAAQPGPDAAQPGLDAALPGPDAAQPGLDAAAPNLDAGILVADAAVEGPDADVATSDAGAAGPDAGGAPPPVTAGCGCGSSGSPGFLGIVALVGLLRRRRAER
jgi:MYXO-CTERM domain-containing protein